MKIAFVTIGDTRDIKRGSGTPYHLWQELLRQGHTVHLVGPLQVKTPFLTRFFKWLSTHMGKRYLSYRDPFMGRALGQAAGRALAGVDVDVMLTNDYCLTGYTPTARPVVLYTDTFFPYDYRENFHPWLANLSLFSSYFCRKTTERGLRRADLRIFASQFVLDEAKKYVSVSGKPLHLIPYGANINSPDVVPTRSIPAIRSKGHLDILFIGKDWELKGGDIAVKVTRQLNRKGMVAFLHVVGVDLSEQYTDAFVTFYGLLNKDILGERRKLEALLLQCDLLLVPSKAEGYGLVFVEAAAYRMPSLSYAVSGTKTASSGVLLDLLAGEDDFVSVIERWFLFPEEYENQANAAYENYLAEKNWKKSVTRLIDLMSGFREKSA